MDTKPAKLFKVGGYLLDPTGRLDANMIRSKIAYGCGYPFVTHYLNVQQEKVREISEDHPLMDENCSFRMHPLIRCIGKIFNLKMEKLIV